MENFMFCAVEIIGAVLLNLSKTFDCNPLDLLIKKTNVYEFVTEAVKLIYFYLIERKQSVRINDIYSNCLKLLSGLPTKCHIGGFTI